MRTARADMIVLTFLISGLILSAGCLENNKRELELKKQLNLSQSKNTKLRRQVEQLTGQLVTGNRLIKSLRKLGPKRLDLLFTVEKITLGRHTGGIDTNDQPGDDAIKVYVSPVDQDGSDLKAAGAIEIKLYDLAKPDGNNNLIAKFSYDVSEVSKLWSSGLFSYHYRLTCPWPNGKYPKNPDITVQVRFTDYLTGKIHVAQKLCRIKLPPPGKPNR